METTKPEIIQSPDEKIIACSVFKYEKDGQKFERFYWAMKAEGNTDDYVILYQNKSSNGRTGTVVACEYDFSQSPPQPLSAENIVDNETWDARLDRDEGEPSQIQIAVAEAKNGRALTGYHKIGGENQGYWLGGATIQCAKKDDVVKLFSHFISVHQDGQLDRGWTKSGFGTIPQTLWDTIMYPTGGSKPQNLYTLNP